MSTRTCTIAFRKCHSDSRGPLSSGKYDCFLQLLSIRGEIFDTFQKRHRGVGDLGDVQLTADSLHR
jgi:hypothetical protein